MSDVSKPRRPKAKPNGVLQFSSPLSVLETWFAQRQKHARNAGRSIRKKQHNSLLALLGMVERRRVYSAPADGPVSTAAASPDCLAHPSYQCRLSSSSLNSILWRFTPQLPARQGREGAVGYWSAVSIGTERAPAPGVSPPSLTV
jgi:hypothetical protein